MKRPLWLFDLTYQDQETTALLLYCFHLASPLAQNLRTEIVVDLLSIWPLHCNANFQFIEISFKSLPTKS